MANHKLTTAIQTLGHTQALKDGTVQPRGFEFEFEEVSPIIRAFRRMVRGLEFDVSEMALTTYICAKSHGKRFTALPIFVVRAFHHGAIVVNAKSGITDPRQLEGGKVGVNRGYTVTTGVWARGIMQDEYGVDLSRITWVLSGDEHVEEFRPGANVVSMPQGRTLEAMLEAGELDAAIGIASDHPDLRPLIPDAAERGFRLLAEQGHYPINHTIVVKDELLQAHPGLAQAVYDAFDQAKQLYLARLAKGEIEAPTKADQTYRRVMQTLGGDPLPYGLEPNRSMVDTVIRYAREQGIIDRAYTADELFAPVQVSTRSA
ncbi:ABC transporter substrate-binding protein [Pusillimonas sp.]|uniref:ABC transporter substrate-binding protein n=1 Tax=Pusillimonas sp. TaxID=3040095 RepID=UPI0029A7DE33|nr:ABC transporter substrate-binding protein [Pusillimonas sp.]MDX3894518.1 ABC transporter substrate-binding protein [Pusillimonas sp.]